MCHRRGLPAIHCIIAFVLQRPRLDAFAVDSVFYWTRLLVVVCVF